MSLSSQAFGYSGIRDSRGNPTGFVLEGGIVTDAAATPEAATFGLIGAAGLALLTYSRRRAKR